MSPLFGAPPVGEAVPEEPVDVRVTEPDPEPCKTAQLAQPVCKLKPRSQAVPRSAFTLELTMGDAGVEGVELSVLDAPALEDAEPDTELRLEEILALTEEGAPLDVTGADVLAARLPMLLTDTQEEDEGAGCASGVTGWPWKNVEVP